MFDLRSNLSGEGHYARKKLRVAKFDARVPIQKTAAVSALIIFEDRLHDIRFLYTILPDKEF